MAKIRKRKVRWKGSNSSDVVGYKLYWAVGGKWGGLNYDSDSVEFGDVAEVILPDEIPSFPEVADSVAIGVTAVDDEGNESDMVKLSGSMKFSAPEAPTDLVVELI